VAGAGSAQVLQYIDFSRHFYSNLMEGMIELSSVIYLLSVTALALFLGSVSVEMRRWR
jgi:ABC-2 type transport system permease protein